MRKRGNTQAQISLEFLIVVGFAFLMTIPLIIIFYKQSDNINTEIVSSQVDKVVSEIRDAADEVHYLGSPSKKTLSIYMPLEVQSVDISGQSISFIVDSSSGDYEIVKWSASNLTGTIKVFKGIHRISIEAFDNYVDISE